MSTNASYAGLLEHSEVLKSLCGAVLLRATRDRAHLEKHPNAHLDGTADTIESLDKWFSGRWCALLCQAMDLHAEFANIDWQKTSRRVRRVLSGPKGECS